MDDLSHDRYLANKLLRKLHKKNLRKKNETLHKVRLSSDSYRELHQQLQKENRQTAEFPRIKQERKQPDPFIKYQKEWKALRWVKPDLRDRLKKPGEIPRLGTDWQWMPEEDES